jgi:hypothetical protein
MGAPGRDRRRERRAARRDDPFLPAFTRFDPSLSAEGVRRRRKTLATRRPGIDLEPDGRRYFDVHHSAADDLKTVRPRTALEQRGDRLPAYYLANR